MEHLDIVSKLNLSSQASAGFLWVSPMREEERQSQETVKRRERKTIICWGQVMLRCPQVSWIASFVLSSCIGHVLG